MKTTILAIDPCDVFARRRFLNGERPRPLGTLRYYLTGRVNATGFEPFARIYQLVTEPTPAGLSLAMGRARQINLDASQPREDVRSIDLDAAQWSDPRVLNLEPGLYRLHASAMFHQPVEVDVEWPDQANASTVDPALVTLDLHPGYLYPFPIGTTLLRGAVARRDGTPVAGAKVRLMLGPAELLGKAETEYLTDRSGQWALRFPGLSRAVKVRVRIDAPDEPTTYIDAEVFPGRSDNAVNPTGLRGQVSTADGRPIAGVQVTLSCASGDVSTGPDGSWVFLLAPAPGVDDQITDVYARPPSPGVRQVRRSVYLRRGAIGFVPAFRF